MADLVFRARVDLLRRNLGIVQGVLTLIDEHFSRGPSPPAADIKDKLVESRRCLDEVEDAIQNAEPATMSALQSAREWLRQVQNSLFPATPRAGESHTVLPADHSDLKDDLVTKAEACARELTTLVDDFTNARKSTTQLWKEFHELELVCQLLFYEYVDLVRGVALRSSGLDQDLCRIADGLVRSVSKKWQSITIPSRLEKMAPTSGRLIRIGFPEWTIWNVPLAVHEYGHVFTEVVGELENLLLEPPNEQKAKVSRPDRMCLEALMSDAFAALTVGPAYGCAAILTRLDPAAPIRGERNAELVVQRASMILAALRVGNSDDPTRSEEAEGLIDRLGQEWVDAVQATGFEGEALIAHDRADELIQAVNQQCIGRRFPYERWSDFVVTSANQLLAESVPGSETTELDHSSTDVDIRHLLNAAWLCRVRPATDADRVTADGNQFARITERVREIALAWLDEEPGRHGKTGGQDSFDPATVSKADTPRLEKQ